MNSILWIIVIALLGAGMIGLAAWLGGGFDA